MIIKITNYCSMACSHCMEDSTIKGEHMAEDTFARALAFTARVEKKAWAAGCRPMLLLSGGEATEHPRFERFFEAALATKAFVILITNGMWLGNQELRESILRRDRTNMRVQVTNDTRYYPTAPPRFEDERITYVDSLTMLLPLGRAARRRGKPTDVPSRQAPTSFNLRSMTRSFRSIEDAVVLLRQRAALGKSGNCIPSVAANGDVMAGETNSCWKIGTVDSSNEELTRNLINMQCNRCGLVENLTLEQKRAIGESTLYGADE